MRKISKKQEQLYIKLVALHHELIRAKHFKNGEQFDEVINKIKEEVNK